MSVRREERRDPKTGSTREFYMVDIDFEHADGTRTRVRKVPPVQTKRGAEQYERDIRNALLDGTYGKEAPKAAPMLKDFRERFIKDHCIANHHKPSGICGKESVFDTHLLPLFKTRRLDAFTVDDELALKGRFTSKAASTYNNAATIINTVLSVAAEWKVIPQVPHRFEILKRCATKPKFYDFDQYEALLEAAETLDFRYYLLSLLGGDAGLRRGEILALKRSAIDLRLGLISVELSNWKGHVTPTKGMEVRVVPMTTRLRAALTNHVYRHPEWVLWTDAGEEEGITGVNGKTLQTWMTHVQKFAGFQKTTGDLHILRHTFCSHLAMRGAPALSIQKLAGHKDLRTTLGYMHLAAGETDRAIRLLEAPVPALHGGGNMTATEIAA